jgi:lipopolysaccharide/colanic/teichoic acid biosynthesis glycosyltransferase
MYRTAGKRIFDVTIAISGLLFLSPLLAILFIFQSVYYRGKPLFLRHRPGLGGKLFLLIKFKTMSDARQGTNPVLPEDQYVTRIGKILRMTSLDELPQLWNVLKGDMSLVGPRPLLPEYLSLYTSIQHKRHDAKPGVTGWAQINGRNSISWEQKFNFDLWYVDHISFALDLKILLLTARQVFTIKDTNQHFVEKFRG